MDRTRDRLLWAASMAFILLVIPLSGCTEKGDIHPGDEIPWDGIGLNETGATQQGVEDMSGALNRFGIDMYLKLSENGENAFISPYSIFTALSMTYEGARNDTAGQMHDMMYLPEDDLSRRASFARMQNLIRNNSGEFELSSANRIWPQEGYPFLPSFFDLIVQYYYGGVQELDFENDPDGSRQTINAWVKEQTRDRIKDLIPEGAIDPLTVMVLTNAIYFYGEWLYEFNKKDTKEEDFTLSSGSTVKAPMMSMKVEQGLNYYEDDSLQAVELPYKGEELSMIVLLPSGNDISSLERSFSADKLNDVLSGMNGSEVNVHMPRFEIEADHSLKEPLEALGMVDAFDPARADLSGLNAGIEPLFVSAVLHKSFVKVNEEGTEAAAATAVIVGRLSIGPEIPTFKADRPFMFLIMHKETNSILFMGKVSDPTE
ncbi:MAG: serpin family protein [Candidatus Thermoplasmatota archaeon]|nr:serpin family protein [Candidatus Thermoplasmatota archaeon]